MDLSRVYFYKTIEEAKTAIKQYSKVHYFIRLIRPRRIKKIIRRESPQRNCIRRESPPMNKKICIHRESSPTNNKKFFIGNRFRRINKNLFIGIPDE